MAHNEFTRQGVRNLNILGKNVNGKRRSCIHEPKDVFVSSQNYVDTDDEGDIFENILSCDGCGEVLGPESRFNARVGHAGH